VPLKNDWQNGDLFTPAAANDMANAVNNFTLVFNVKDYGAVGDASTDDKVSIQNAINAAVAAGGGTVHLPVGNYKISGHLTIGGGNVDISGVGNGSVVKPIYAVASNRVFFNSVVTSNLSFRNFKVDLTGTNVQHGFLMNGVTNLSFDGVEFQGPSPIIGGCIAVSGVGTSTRFLSKNVQIVNCRFKDTTNFGVAVSYVDGALIANNLCENAGREVLGVEPEASCVAQNVTIANNVIIGATTVVGSSTGFIVITESSGGTIDNVTVTGNSIRQVATPASAQTGITVIGAANVNVTGNTVQGMGGVGIQAGNLDYATTGVVIAGNTVTDCGVHTSNPAIYLRNAQSCSVTGNYVFGAGHSFSIIENGGAANNLISANILRDTVPFDAAGTGTLRFGNKNAASDATMAVPSMQLGSTDTTLSRSAAGVLAVEGVNVLLDGGALGTPGSGTLTNCTGLPVAGVTASTSTALGVGSVELGDASDTTLSRSAAGVLAVEGVVVPTVSSTSTLTNKTLTSPVINTPTGIVKGDVGLGNVDNTSNATERAATATLTNKTIQGTRETVHAITDGAAFEIDPRNGGIQTITLGASRTPKGTNFESGHSMTLMVAATANTITWTDATLNPTWIGGSAPALSATQQTVISLWEVGSTIYGSLIGYA
jgi:hypothetical protein